MWIGRSSIYICTMGAQHRASRSGGVRPALQAIPQKENLPRVSFQRRNPHLLFSKVIARYNITVEAVMSSNSYTLFIYMASWLPSPAP